MFVGWDVLYMALQGVLDIFERLFERFELGNVFFALVVIYGVIAFLIGPFLSRRGGSK